MDIACQEAGFVAEIAGPMDNSERESHGLKHGDRHAWSTIYDLHNSAVYGLAYHLLGRNRPLAEDVHQEVWLLALERIDQFDAGRGNFREWILGITRNQVARRFRAQNRMHELFSDEPEAAQLPLELLEASERADVVRAALLLLSAPWRNALLQKYCHGLTVAEIAQRMKLTEKAVESMLSRARERLRRLLSPYFTNKNEGTCDASKISQSTKR